MVKKKAFRGLFLKMKLFKLGEKSSLKTQRWPEPLSHPTEEAATAAQTI